jgi:hypothetical protein
MEEQIIFDEEVCAEFIFKKLIEKGIAVNIDDIRLIMDLEYEYGESIELYPPKNEDGERAPIENKVLITIRKVDGATHLHSEVEPEEAIELLKEAVETIRAMD